MSTHQANSNSYRQPHSHSLVPTRHTQRHTHSWQTCLPLATSQSHAPFLPVWNVGAAVVPGFPHFGVNDSEAGCTKEVCPMEQRLSDQPPHNTRTHTQEDRVVNRASRHTIWMDCMLLSANQAWETLTVRIGEAEIETESKMRRISSACVSVWRLGNFL